MEKTRVHRATHTLLGLLDPVATTASSPRSTHRGPFFASRHHFLCHSTYGYHPPSTSKLRIYRFILFVGYHWDASSCCFRVNIWFTGICTFWSVWLGDFLSLGFWRHICLFLLLLLLELGSARRRSAVSFNILFFHIFSHSLFSSQVLMCRPCRNEALLDGTMR
ncbi:hypothetical protein LX36DRAFT_331704 [Colletotrichum falcatum]|nr:hypothetical protein LX36DRAFT_331704 [Colletotrichum falcatum]